MATDGGGSGWERKRLEAVVFVSDSRYRVNETDIPLPTFHWNPIEQQISLLSNVTLPGSGQDLSRGLHYTL